MSNQKWIIDTTHSTVGFKIKHMMITNIKGVFSDYKGEMILSDENFENASLSFEGQAKSISTNNQDRDNHLRSADFFDVDSFPTLSFKSSSVTKKSGNNFIVKGNLDLHGVSNEITLDTEFGGIMNDPWGNPKVGINLYGKINRKDWGLNWNSTLETGGILVSEEVRLEIELQFVKG